MTVQNSSQRPLIGMVRVDYVKRDEAETTVLCELIAYRYEADSVVITSNQASCAWDTVFPDDMMAVAAMH